MRDYAKVGPQFWNGRTGKALKAKGSEAVIVGLYLMTCQHANMLGLYYLSKVYIAADTGLGLEGASKGLRSACEVGFCSYDDESEVVWVTEMALYQIADQLEAKDNRCKGVQREYDALPENPFLTPFYERYAGAFHMTSCRRSGFKEASPLEAPSETLRSQEQEQEQEQEQKKGKTPPRKRADAASEVDRPDDVAEQVWKDWVQLRKDKRAKVSLTAIEGAREEAAKAGLSLDAFLRIWCRRGSQGLDASWIKPNERSAATTGETAYQRSMRERAEQITPRIAAKAPGAHSNVIEMEVPSVIAGCLGR